MVCFEASWLNAAIIVGAMFCMFGLGIFTAFIALSKVVVGPWR